MDTAGQFEYVRCNLCGADAPEPFAEGTDRLLKRGERFTLVRCSRCGLVYLNPRPALADLARHYPPEYVAYKKIAAEQVGIMGRGTGRYARLKNRIKQSILERYYGYPAADTRGGLPRWRVRLFLGVFRRMYYRTVPWVAGGRVLDVGCGNAAYLAWLKQLGWQVQGVEIDPGCVRYAREVFGIDVFAGRLRDAGFADESFDCITLWHSLEHCEDPSGILAECRRILKKGGLLVICVPNVGSWEAALFKQRSLLCDLPRHFYDFSGRTLSRLLEKNALSLRHIRYLEDVPIIDWTLNGWLAEKNIPLRLPAGMWRSPLLRPLYALMERLRTANVMICYARR
ncbi:MAG TPA: class I SAM-dependent methyltransferase [Candidatus Omnitrophota bacterium]|nr:class I SAM-dependent methyltransferase [Candidatus Omnitrophota bacterium]HRZ14502.1 class I SAM-dependent methyltransferase [Candidatus Omnitrophota bacterium]